MLYIYIYIYTYIHTYIHIYIYIYIYVFAYSVGTLMAPNFGALALMAPLCIHIYIYIYPQLESAAGDKK